MATADPIVEELSKLLKESAQEESAEEENTENETEAPAEESSTEVTPEAPAADAPVEAEVPVAETSEETTEVAKEAVEEAEPAAETAVADAPSEPEAEATEEVGEESSEEEQPVADADPVDAEIASLLDAYRTKKKAYFAAKKAQEEKNWEEKQALIKEMQELIQQEENIGRAYNRINEIREAWKEIGDVPRAKYPEMQVTYSKLNEQFYYNINIYKELREHDFKRNAQLNREVIEKLDGLLKLDSIRETEKQIKKLQADWEAIGPTNQDEWEEIKDAYWTRVKSIYNKIREFYDERRTGQEANLQAKRELLTKVEELTASTPESHKGWEAQTKSLLGLQADWKKVGFAGKGEAEEVWTKFRGVCDAFFAAKKVFYDGRRSEFDDQRDKKKALVEKAEALKDSEDWINTSKALIQLQKQWKQIGNAGPRHEHKLWTAFRAACDYFFDARKAKEAEKDAEFVKNLEVKQEMIKKIEAYKPADDPKQVMADLKALSKEFNAIGHVPSANKDEIYKAYKAALDAHYDSINLDKEEKEKFLFEARMEQLKGSPDADRLLDKERGKLRSKISELNTEIIQFENNLGFFANSKGAEKIIADVQVKIDKNKAEIEAIKMKMRMMG